MNNLQQKAALTLLVSITMLVVTAIGMMTVGSAPIEVNEIVRIIGSRLFTSDLGAVNPAHNLIIGDIRWPRVALAMLVGSSLAVSGACYQAMFKNPLADPFILGVSSGAALGAATAIVLNQTAYVSLFAFGGSAITIFVVYFLGNKAGEGVSANQLLLAGVAFGSMLNALLSSLMALNTQQISTILFWLLGSLTNPPANLPVIAIIVIAGIALIMLYARDLDVISAGDENAQYLGVDVARVKIILLLATTLITSAVVAVSGIIGFIGLIVPHMLRRVVGPQHRLLLPLCAMWGAVLLLWADGITRIFVSLSQIPVGVITALLGSPFFLYVLARSGRR
jgi:iron complex transport system permease protein